jgi:hypothetical protein
MLRALTIRFTIMAICIGPLVIYLNAVEASYFAALAAVGVYCAIGIAIIGRYVGAHVDEIPDRAIRRNTHRA